MSKFIDKIIDKIEDTLFSKVDLLYSRKLAWAVAIAGVVVVLSMVALVFGA